jgi:hypothetical protein
LDRGSGRQRVARTGKTAAKKNTGDLQWKIGANYNARPCDSERNAPGAGTMENNGKNNAQNNRKQSDIRARADVRS